MTAPSDAEETPVRRSIFRNLSNTGYMVNIQLELNLFFSLIFYLLKLCLLYKKKIASGPVIKDGH